MRNCLFIFFLFVGLNAFNQSKTVLLNHLYNNHLYREFDYVLQNDTIGLKLDSLSYFKILNHLRKNQENGILENFELAKNLIISDTSFKGFSCLDEITQDKTNYEKYVKYSKLLPGLGTFVLGEKRKVITSILFTGLTTYAVEELLRHKLYKNALGFVLVYWLKFYQGNYLLTEEIINDKIAKKENDLANQCEVVFSNLLKSYSLKFK